MALSLLFIGKFCQSTSIDRLRFIFLHLRLIVLQIHRDNLLRLQLDINQLRLQSNEISIALIQRVREISDSRRNISPPTPTDRRQIDLSLSMKMVSIVICDTVPGNELDRRRKFL